MSQKPVMKHNSPSHVTRQDNAYPIREVRFCENTGSQDRICRSQTSTYDEGSRKRYLQNQISEQSSDQEAKGHDGAKHHSHALPMAGEIGSWQFDTHGEHLHSHDDASDLLGEAIVEEPIPWAQGLSAFGSNCNA